MPLRNNNIAVRSRPIPNRLCSNERRRVCNQVSPGFLHISILQRNRLYRSHFRFICCALSRDIGPWRSDLPQCLSYTVRNSSCPSSGRYSPWPFHRPSSLLGHRLSCHTVQRKQDPDFPPAWDHSARCDALFPDYIHFAFVIRADSIACKGKNISIALHIHSTARWDPPSLHSSWSLPRKWYWVTFPSFFHRIFLHTTVQSSCTSESLFVYVRSERCLRYLPVMITRLILSLKKADASKVQAWSLREPTAHTTMRFAERQGGAITGDEMRLDTFANMRDGTQNLAWWCKGYCWDFVPSRNTGKLYGFDFRVAGCSGDWTVTITFRLFRLVSSPSLFLFYVPTWMELNVFHTHSPHLTWGW